MRAEVISIGDELTSGQRLDTNSQWLSLRLGELGVPVLCHATVADDLAANVEVFRQAAARAEIVILTGGLGPTADDLTREALARLSGQPLVLDEAALEHIKALFARRKRPMPERNVVQAMFPAGSKVIANPEGTAPGIAIDVKVDGHTSHLFALPGVPAEMRQMWHQSVVPALAALGAGREMIRHRRIKCFGVGESDLEQMLPDLIRRGRLPQVGITVHEATITLRITASGASEAACYAAMDDTVATIHECLGKLVFGEEDDELEDAIVRLLREQNKTLATCEWGTAGLVADWFGALTAREPYLGGLVGTRGATLASLLDLPSGTLADAKPAAIESLARACRQRTGADYALAIGPFPTSQPADGEIPRVIFAIASANGEKHATASYTGHSAIIKPLAAKRALDFLRLELLEAT